MRFIFAQRRPPPPPFTLESVPDLFQRFRAQSIGGLSDGDPVNTWADLSGNGYDASYTGAAGGTAPTWKPSQANGRAAVRFNGSNSLIHGGFGGQELWNAYSLFVVCRPAATQSGWRGLYSCKGGISGPAMFSNLNGPDQWGTYSTSLANQPAGQTLGAGEMSVLVMVGAAGGAGTFYRNAGSGVGYGATESQGLGMLGGYVTFGQGFNGDLFEVLAYSRQLTPTERANVIAWLRSEYGF